MRGPLQLFDPVSSTFTYIIADASTREAVLIDGVDSQIERDLAHLARLGLALRYTVETHVHADHVTSAAALRARAGSIAIVPAGGKVHGADREVRGGDVIAFGSGSSLSVLSTPGHTIESISLVWEDCVFTGDALMVEGCGRTDFQQGDAGVLYDAVTGVLFALPETTCVYPAHDYRGNQVSTIGHERRHNPRFAGRSREAFIALMASLDLPMPKLIDVAVPANRALGVRQP